MSVATYTQAQQRLLARCGIDAESRFIDVPAVDGRAHVLITGEGPPVMMVIGAGAPTAIWAPLMAELTGFTLYAVDPPGMGLTTRVPYTTEGRRTLAVEFLDQVVERRIGSTGVRRLVHGRALDHVAGARPARTGVRHRLHRLPGR